MTSSARANVRLDQVRDFVAFFLKYRDERNIAIFAGDFNIGADTEGYNTLIKILAEIPVRDDTPTGFEDFWLFGVEDPTADRLAGTSRSGDDKDPKREKDFSH